MAPLLFLLLAAAFLAYANGANDNFKGVASLYGSRATGYRTALGWATLTTLAGSITSIFYAQALLQRFSGKGIVPAELVQSPQFLLAVALGAGLTVILATLTGFPVSTTHGLIGAMIGSGLLAVGHQVNFAALQKSFLLPLLLSPLLAIALGGLLYLLLHRLRLAGGIGSEWCLCLGQTRQPVPMPNADGTVDLSGLPAEYATTVASAADCEQRYPGAFFGVRLQALMDGAHLLSAGAVCFARALNDTPKIVAILLVAKALEIRWGFLMVAGTMAIGGLIHSRRIAETMGRKLTAMNHGQGFSANLSTGLLVIAASRYGLPVSTTHVAVGSLFGIGLCNRRAKASVMAGIALSWLITLPCAALLGATVWWVISRI